MSDFDAKFVQDEELRSLLQEWNVPHAQDSLDNRVAAGYQQMMSSSALRDSALHPVRDSEVVAMKFCSTCQEQFADRFSFCPVDGTPLSTAPDAMASDAAPEIKPSSSLSGGARPGRAATEPSYFQAPPAPIPRYATAAAADTLPEFHLTILEDHGLVYRLADELREVAHNYQLTWPEFKRDPFGFVKRSVQGYGKMVGEFFSNRDVKIAALISIAAMVILVGGIILIDRTQSAGVSRVSLTVFALAAFAALIALFSTWLSRDRGAAVMGARPSDSGNVLAGIAAAFVAVFGIVGIVTVLSLMHSRAVAKARAQEDELVVQNLFDIPNEQPTPDEGTAGFAKGNGGGSKKEKEKPGGGGGGGREEQLEASNGKLPQSDLRIPQVVAPDPHPPVIKNPALPMPATLDLDPALNPPDTRQLNYGDPRSKQMTPSSGSGTGNGMGSGSGGGIGPGEGGGYGPGRGGNMGGGDRREGGGGPGGGGGGTDYNRVFSGKEVNQKARILEKPEPTYTEEARKNQITGTVVLRAVFSSSGQVTNIVAVSRLPDGLTERAIGAARRIRFVPAMKDGHPVSMYMQLEYNFNLY